MELSEFFWAIRSSHLQDEMKWRHTREIISIIYNVNAKKGKQSKAKDLIPLTIDSINGLKKEVKRLTVEQFELETKRLGLKTPSK